MATEFTAAVESAGGDYTTVALAEAGLQNDLTAADIKVFSISANTTPTLVAGDTCVGQTSGATGVIVLVNAARTQVLIKTIAVAAFQSGEVVQKTGDAGVTVTLSNAGDSPIIGIQAGAITETSTSATTVSGWTTGASNYIRIYAKSGAEAQVPYSTSGTYRREAVPSGTNGLYALEEEFVRLERLQITATAPASALAVRCVRISAGATSNIQLLGCHLRGVMHASNTTRSDAVIMVNAETVRVINCVIQGFTDTGNTTNTGIFPATNAGAQTVYNCLVYNCARGVDATSSGTDTTCKNVAYDSNGLSTADGFVGTMNAASNYNASDLATDAPGANSRDSQTYTYVDEGNANIHFATSDTAAVNFGTDLSGDAAYNVTTDFDAVARSGTWDIGPYNVSTGGVGIGAPGQLGPRFTLMGYPGMLSG